MASIWDMMKFLMPVFMSAVQLGQASHIGQSGYVEFWPTLRTHLPQLLIAPLHSPEIVIPKSICDWLLPYATQPACGQ